MRLPHLDTPDVFFRNLPERELEQVKTDVISNLLRNKVIAPEKFRGHYVIAIDGTGLASYDKRHCGSCLTKTSNRGK